MAARLIAKTSVARPYKTYEARSVAEVMSIVRRRADQDFMTVFRGQREDLPLVPSIGRAPIAADFGAIPARRRSAWYADPPTRGVRLLEAVLLDEFEKMAPGHESNLPSDRWEMLAVAQHFGLPTRLLDWTTNPHVALWFVVQRPPPPEQRRPGILWIHVPGSDDFVTESERQRSPLDISRPTPDLPIVYLPRFVTPRIRAQSGVFTIHQFNDRHQAFRPVDRFGDHRECMTKVRVPVECFDWIRYELDLVGVNAGSLLPGLDGLARGIVDTYMPAAPSGGRAAAGGTIR